MTFPYPASLPANRTSTPAERVEIFATKGARHSLCFADLTPRRRVQTHPALVYYEGQWYKLYARQNDFPLIFLNDLAAPQDIPEV